MLNPSRLRLNLTRELVRDPSLDVRVVLLVRDPRGTMLSRRHGNVARWCTEPDCTDPGRVCRDLLEDHRAARRLVAEHPDRYRVVRYEDLALRPADQTRSLL